MNNNLIIEQAIKELGCEVGCIDKEINIFSSKAMKLIVSELGEDYHDFLVTDARKLYIVEVSTCDNEKDISVYEAWQYFCKYGTLEEWYDEDELTATQYKKIKAQM